MKVSVGFHHTAGGDSLLPAADHGFFDGYEVEVDAKTPQEAEQLGMVAMHEMAHNEHPDWIVRAIEDLCTEVYVHGIELEYDEDDWDKPIADAQTRPTSDAKP